MNAHKILQTYNLLDYSAVLQNEKKSGRKSWWLVRKKLSLYCTFLYVRHILQIREVTFFLYQHSRL